MFCSGNSSGKYLDKLCFMVQEFSKMHGFEQPLLKNDPFQNIFLKWPVYYLGSVFDLY